MKKVKIKVPAKLNLTLDVLGVEQGYHALKSLVCSVSIYDTVTVSKRKDSDITLKTFGIDAGCSEQDNNAYKTAKVFMQTQNTCGIDVVVNKNIPVGGGLGGSSADIAGVLKGCNKLFNSDCDLSDLASKLGSDVNYMLNGGYALIEGKGDKVTPVNAKTKLYFLVVSLDKSISAKECYKAYDDAGVISADCTDTAVNLLKCGDVKSFIGVIKNDLTAPAVKLLPEIKQNLATLDAVQKGFMTGSGSATYMVFKSRRKRNVAYNILKHHFGKNLIKAHTV